MNKLTRQGDTDATPEMRFYFGRVTSRFSHAEIYRTALALNTKQSMSENPPAGGRLTAGLRPARRAQVRFSQSPRLGKNDGCQGLVQVNRPSFLPRRWALRKSHLRAPWSRATTSTCRRRGIFDNTLLSYHNASQVAWFRVGEATAKAASSVEKRPSGEGQYSLARMMVSTRTVWKGIGAIFRSVCHHARR